MLNLAEIEKLAPDKLTWERALKLAGNKKWKELHLKDTVLWGYCRSSGATYFRAVANWKTQKFYSNSPLPQQPDKYVLALLLLYEQDPQRFKPAQELPQWVETGLQKPPPVGKSALQKQVEKKERQEKRIRSMQTGIQELRNWLQDVTRQGLAQLHAADEAYWESIATRLVDNKLGSIANRIRNLRTVRNQTDWPARYLEEIAALHLFVQGFERIDEVPEPLQEEMLQLGGMNVRKEDLRNEKSVQDQWMVIGQSFSEQNRLYARKLWLWGARQERGALILDYNYGSAQFEGTYKVGMALSAELIYYPGAYPLRAVITKQQPSKEAITLQGYDTLSDGMNAYAAAMGQNPWLQQFPVLLEGVRPLKQGDKWLVADKQGHYLPLKADMESNWILLAVSAGKTVLLFGLWNGHVLEPLATASGGRLLSLQKS